MRYMTDGIANTMLGNGCSYADALPIRLRRLDDYAACNKLSASQAIERRRIQMVLEQMQAQRHDADIAVQDYANDL